jgi:hypothetical protein
MRAFGTFNILMGISFKKKKNILMGMNDPACSVLPGKDMVLFFDS